MSNPEISVVIASFDHAPYVREALESVLGQSRQDFEIVITDDGSRDRTVEIIRSVSDPRIHLEVLSENRGACIALNSAIRRSRGRYVAVLNSDDYFLPNKLERQISFLEANPDVGAVFALPEFVDERGNRFRNPRHAFAGLFTGENRSRRGWLRTFFDEGNRLCHPTLMIRRHCYDQVGLLDPLLMQLPDLDLWVRLCTASEIHVLPEKLTAFRILDRERNTSAPTRERLARTAWETAAVLHHYRKLPDDELRRIFSGTSYWSNQWSPRISLALACLQIRRPGFAPFGLDLLRDCLREDDNAFPVLEYFRLVGSADPYCSEFFRREFQWLKRSSALALIRKLHRWVHSKNLQTGR